MKRVNAESTPAMTPEQWRALAKVDLWDGPFADVGHCHNLLDEWAGEIERLRAWADDACAELLGQEGTIHNDRGVGPFFLSDEVRALFERVRYVSPSARAALGDTDEPPEAEG